MNLSIRKNVIENIKSDNYEDIITTINESVNTGDEIVLPGLGVILELFWNNLKLEDKEYIAKIIKKNITNK
jgi:small acid-soluble spore protein I (minor)